MPNRHTHTHTHSHTECPFSRFANSGRQVRAEHEAAHQKTLKRLATDYISAQKDADARAVVLAGFGLSSVPGELFSWSLFSSWRGSLTVVDVSNNALEEIPAAVRKLEALTHFNCSYNRLTLLPESLAECTRLAALEVQHNNLAHVPLRVGELQVGWRHGGGQG